MLIISRDAEVLRQERADAYFLTMNTTYHVNWTDAPILTPLMSWLGLTGPINPYRGFAATNAYTVAFFDRYLKAQRPALLDGSTPDWPEVTLETRRGRVLGDTPHLSRAGGRT